MNQWIMKRVDDAYNWLAGPARALAGTSKVIVLVTRSARTVRATVSAADSSRGVLVIRSFDGTTDESIEVAEIHSVVLTGERRLTPSDTYREMRQMERVIHGDR